MMIKKVLGEVNMELFVDIIKFYIYSIDIIRFYQYIY